MQQISNKQKENKLIVEVMLVAKTRLNHPEFKENQYKTAAAAKAAAVEAVRARAPTTPLRLLASPGAAGRTGACKPAATVLDHEPAENVSVKQLSVAAAQPCVIAAEFPSDQTEIAT